MSEASGATTSPQGTGWVWKFSLALTASVWGLQALLWTLDQATDVLESSAIQVSLAIANLCVDFAAWVGLGSVLAGLNRQLVRVYDALAERRTTCLRLAGSWSLATVSVLSLLAVARDGIARLFGCVTNHLTSHRFVGYEVYGMTRDRDRHNDWMARWDSGEIFQTELVFLALCIALHVAVARGLGKAGSVASSFALLTTWVIAFLFTEHAGAVIHTYDMFFESIVTGQIVYALSPFMIGSSVLATVHLMLFAVISANVVILRSPVQSALEARTR